MIIVFQILPLSLERRNPLKHNIMTVITVILILLIIAGILLTVYTWVHFQNESEKAPTTDSLSVKAAAGSPLLGLSAVRQERIRGISEARAS